MIRKIPAGNIRLSAAILYAGAMPTKNIRVLEVETISVETYFRHQRDYCFLRVQLIKKQTELLSSLGDQHLVLAGDGRAWTQCQIWNILNLGNVMQLGVHTGVHEP